MPTFEFAGKTSLVTGASSGLGAEFARQLAARAGRQHARAQLNGRNASTSMTRGRITPTGRWPGHPGRVEAGTVLHGRSH